MLKTVQAPPNEKVSSVGEVLIVMGTVGMAVVLSEVLLLGLGSAVPGQATGGKAAAVKAPPLGQKPESILLELVKIVPGAAVERLTRRKKVRIPFESGS